MTDGLSASDSSRRIPRRTIAKGVAWSVPVVAMASAAPAYAATEPPVTISWAGSGACKIPGNSLSGYCYNKGYVLWAKFTNNTNTLQTICVTAISTGIGADLVNRCLVGIVDAAVNCSTNRLANNCFTVPANGDRYIGIYSNSSSDSSGTRVTVTFNYVGYGGVQTAASTFGDVIGGSWSNPDGGGSCSIPAGFNGVGCVPRTTPLSACNTNCASP